MITIHGKDYNLKFSLRTMLIFERLASKSVAEISTLMDQIIYMYSALLAANSDMELKFEDLVDAIDDDMSIITQFQDAVMQNNLKNSVFTKEENTEDSKKKS